VKSGHTVVANPFRSMYQLAQPPVEGGLVDVHNVDRVVSHPEMDISPRPLSRMKRVSLEELAPRDVREPRLAESADASDEDTRRSASTR
jgi:hypothetical protein